MKFRALDGAGDWAWGAGIQSYATDQRAVAYSIQTRVLMFLNDCFFAPDQGIDWFNLLGSKNEAGLIFSIRSTILNTPGVNTLTDLSTTVDAETRNLTVQYQVTTVFGFTVASSIVFPITPFSGISKWVSDVVFDGVATSIDVVVSTQISDARDAIWILYGPDGSQVVGAVIALNATTVRLSVVPALAAGTYHLVGIA